MDNILHILDTPIIMIHCADFLDIGLSHPQVQKSEMINLSASVKIFKNKLKKTEKLINLIYTSHITQREMIN